jgi:hypothetical protein
MSQSLASAWSSARADDLDTRVYIPMVLLAMVLLLACWRPPMFVGTAIAAIFDRELIQFFWKGYDVLD